MDIQIYCKGNDNTKEPTSYFVKKNVAEVYDIVMKPKLLPTYLDLCAVCNLIPIFILYVGKLC